MPRAKSDKFASASAPAGAGADRLGPMRSSSERLSMGMGGSKRLSRMSIVAVTAGPVQALQGFGGVTANSSRRSRRSESVSQRSRRRSCVRLHVRG